MKTISDQNTREQLISRIEQISEDKKASCDVYEFDEENKIKSITSYCITERN